ncbi:hypothetical protein CBL_01136 [Carabus blaptoides fortunei]
MAKFDSLLISVDNSPETPEEATGSRFRHISLAIRASIADKSDLKLLLPEIPHARSLILISQGDPPQRQTSKHARIIHFQLYNITSLIETKMKQHYSHALEKDEPIIYEYEKISTNSVVIIFAEQMFIMLACPLVSQLMVILSTSIHMLKERSEVQATLWELVMWSLANENNENIDK